MPRTTGPYECDINQTQDWMPTPRINTNLSISFSRTTTEFDGLFILDDEFTWYSTEAMWDGKSKRRSAAGIRATKNDAINVGPL